MSRVTTLLAIVVAALTALWFTNAMFSAPEPCGNIRNVECMRNLQIGAAVAEQIARDKPNKNPAR